MWRMKMLKSVEFYRGANKKPWRVSLLERTDGQKIIEMTVPAADTACVQCKTLTMADYEETVEIIRAAVRPDIVAEYRGAAV